ncbi:MAG: hypothetical protein ACOWWM_19385 [Desulfobacterales bacterium]
MSFTISYDEPNTLFYVRICDQDTLHDNLVGMRLTFTHPRWRPGSRVLVDYREVLEATQKPTDSYWLAQAREMYYSFAAPSRVAAVADPESLYNANWLTSMCEIDRNDGTTRIFHNWEKVVKWLNLPESYEPPTRSASWKGNSSSRN